MANIFVYIEQNRGVISDCNLKAINIARKIASDKGAVLYGILAVDKEEQQNQQVISILSTYAIDKLIITEDEVFKAPDRADTIEKIYPIIKSYNPVMFIFGDSPSSREMASWFSGKTDGTFISEFSSENFSGELKENYPYSDEVFLFNEHTIEKPIIALVKNSFHSIGGNHTSMEVKVEHIDDFSIIDYKVEKNTSGFQMDTLLFAGSKISSSDMKQLVEIAGINEWYLVSSKNDDFPDVFEVPISGFINKFILWGCSKEESLLSSLCWSESTRVLFIDSDYTNIRLTENTAVWNGNTAEITEIFKTGMF